MPTYVYMSTSTQSDVSIKLVNHGPDNGFWKDFRNPASSVPKNVTDQQVLTIDRGDPGIGDQTTMAELQLSIDGQFIAALEIILSVGSFFPFKSFICWAWRTATPTTGRYETDYGKYSTTFSQGGWIYEFSVKGKSTAWFDDIYISLTSSIERSRWMEALKPQITNKPLNEIRIPGSHDSGTSSITSSSPWAPDSTWWQTFSSERVARWSKTQSKQIGAQLLDGIRYFDLRVAPASNANGYVLVHALEGDDLQKSFKAVCDFLVSHPQEIIILDLNHFYKMQTTDHDNVVGMIKTILGKFITPPTQGVGVTPGKLWGSSQRVIVAYNDDSVVDRYPNILWRRQEYATSAIWSPNPDTNDIGDLVTKLKGYLAARAPIRFFVLQCVLAPGAVQVMWPGHSLESWARDTTNPAVATWITTSQWKSNNSNIIMCDFYEESDIVGKVITLNM